ncbi:hypothetical protein Dimus_017617 [Dionaea muscipula]
MAELPEGRAQKPTELRSSSNSSSSPPQPNATTRQGGRAPMELMKPTPMEAELVSERAWEHDGDSSRRRMKMLKWQQKPLHDQTPQVDELQGQPSSPFPGLKAELRRMAMGGRAPPALSIRTPSSAWRPSSSPLPISSELSQEASKAELLPRRAQPHARHERRPSMAAAKYDAPPSSGRATSPYK